MHRDIAQALAWTAESRSGPGRLPEHAGLADLARAMLELHDGFLPIQGATCGRGCSACCHQQAPVSPAEAFHLAPIVRVAPWPGRMRRSRRLAAAAQRRDPEVDPHRLWMNHRLACPFLESDGACGIYRVRPLICREHLVSSPADHCADPSGQGVVIMSLPLSLSEALSQVCARLLAAAVVRIALPGVLGWVRRHGAAGRRCWPRHAMVAAVHEAVRGR